MHALSTVASSGQLFHEFAQGGGVDRDILMTGPSQQTSKVDESEQIRRAKAEADAGDVLYRAGQFGRALELFSAAQQLRPNDPEYAYKVACAAWRANAFDLVELNLLKTLEQVPEHASVHEALVLWYLHEGDVPRALHHSAKTLSLRPGNVDFLITRADVLIADGQIGAAWEILQPLVTSHPPTVLLARCYSKIASHVGHEVQAARMVEQAMSLPRVSPEDMSHLHFIAACLLDKMERYDAAFKQARLANELARRHYDSAAHTSNIYTRIGYYSRRRLRSLPRATHCDRRPVFIVGMPRSGTTLVEQILATHPQIRGAGELAKLSETVRKAATADWSEGKTFPDFFDNLTLGRANELAADYLERIDRVSTTATYVTDKMPHNFLFLGTIQMLFPDSVIIHCVRDPRDTCLSCYFTDFSIKHEFTNDLEDLADFYRDYHRLMEHWKHVLDMPILDVKYEDVIADQRGQTQRMLDFLDLPWDDQCLNFYKNKRIVETASRDQVRKPIYSSSVARWKHYERHIEPLMQLAAELE